MVLGTAPVCFIFNGDTGSEQSLVYLSFTNLGHDRILAVHCKLEEYLILFALVVPLNCTFV